MRLLRSAALLPLALLLCALSLVAQDRLGEQADVGNKAAELVPVGVAIIDITPKQPIRLSGYGSRTRPSEGVSQRLRAQAIAFGENTEASPLSVLVTLDAIGIPRWVTESLAEALEKEIGLPRSQLAVAATHTHAAPSLRGTLPFMFPSGLSEEEREVIEKYTTDLLENLRQVSRDAVEARSPARLSWGKGEVAFAANRRVLEDGRWKGFGVQPDGPVDHTLPVMRIESPDGALRAVLANYACHCTTLGGQFNEVHGDWAGVAREEIEKRHPNAVALIAIGCGADQNPEPRGELEHAIAHGRAIADEVDRLLQSALSPLREPPTGTFGEIELLLQDPPKREVWEEQVREKAKGHHFARAMLDRMDRGEFLPSTVDYPVQTWTFGDDLAMLFLAGEVVVDYAHRFYREFDAERLWINAYSNDVPCYLPSRRITEEGGYEVDYSMVYYGKPARLALDTEDRIADEVLRQMRHPFYSEATRKLLPAPVEKEQALDTIRVTEGYEVELVAAEPLVRDPVDIAWDTGGRLWVVEMGDYPTGIGGKPGQGIVRFLEDVDGDGLFDRSTEFLQGLEHPNSVFPWRDGVLVVTVDRILFARDTDGDGKADERRDVITGFRSGNSQHQLGGLEWGLGNWIHVGNGGSQGELRSAMTGQTVSLGSRDLRFRPDTGEIELLSGETQYGLTRDDWGNWFGCNNSKPWWHYALDDTYTRRNPHVPYPDTKQLLGEEPIAGPVFPISRTLSRFNDYDAANRFTSACGLRAFRDLLPDSSGQTNLFVAEPVHNLVSRRQLSAKGSTFSVHRVEGEEDSEFFASTDNWCRPTSVRTGPDGAVYIVDMYRLVIEHPEWIPARWQRRLDLREGRDRGRIYRVIPQGSRPKPIPDFRNQSTEDLVANLDHRNGSWRDLVHLELLWRADDSAIEPLREMATAARHPEARVQALSVLDGLGGITPDLLKAVLNDGHPGVRSSAIRLAEPLLREGNQDLLPALAALAGGRSGQVRQQLAYSLGESADPMAGETLGKLLRNQGGDSFLLYAIFSSAVPHAEGLLSSVSGGDAEISAEGADLLTRTFLGTGNEKGLARMLALSAEGPDSLERLGTVVHALEKAGEPLSRLAQRKDSVLPTEIETLAPVFALAREIAGDGGRPLEERRSAIGLLGGSPEGIAGDLALLLPLLHADQAPEIQEAAAARCDRFGGTAVAQGLLEEFDRLGVAARKRVLNSLVSRQSWSALLLAEAEKRPEWIRFLDATQRASLQHHSNQEIREQASRLFQGAEEDRKARIDRFRSSLALEGDVQQGQVHFTTLCASCHRVGETGFAVGPDLTALSNRSREALLEAILDPNAAVEGKYAMVVAETEDGRSFGGVMASESSTSLTLMGAGGVRETFLRKDLKHLRTNLISAMPEGLEAALDEKGMADLLSFLQQVGAPQPIVPEGDGALRLGAGEATLSGHQVARDSETGAISWITSDDRVSWSPVRLPAGDYAVFFHAGLDDAGPHGPESFVLEIGDKAVSGNVEYTGSLRRQRKRQFGEVVIPEGRDSIEIRFRHTLSRGSVSIREIALIPRR